MIYSSVSKLNPFSSCEGCSALLIPALPCPISGVHPGKIPPLSAFGSYPPASASLRRGEDAACANSDELVGRVPEGKTSSLTAVLLLIPTVELTCYAGRSSSMPRSLTICPDVDSGRSWRLCVDCTSFVSSRRAELGETRRARPIFAPLLLRVSSPPLVSHPTALLTQSPRVAAPRRRSRECHACQSFRAYRCPCV